jgi:hypothetical protein
MADVGQLIRALKQSRLLQRWFAELAPGGREKIYSATLESQTLVERPAKMPIGIDWPEEVG